MTRVIDFHTHAFPDPVAARAIPALEGAGQVTACLDGRIDSLLGSMDEAGIGKSVLCSIATRPEQFASILSWSEAIRSERIIPFPSVHPDATEALEQISSIREAGFLGIKMHPSKISCWTKSGCGRSMKDHGRWSDFGDAHRL
ncbi:MAG: hypothetical protein WC256_13310 [Desulfurivibrionaceae bacterium]|jgi:hypothetical protein